MTAPVVRHDPRSMVMTRIGGREYPMKSHPRCKTCQHPRRMDIENSLLAGRSYRGLLADLDDDDLKPSYDGIRAHFQNGHMPLHAASQVALIERNAKRQGIKIEEAVEDLVDHITVAEMVVKQGFERMQRGEIQPEMADTLAAVKIVEQIQARTNSDLDHEMWVSATMSMLEDAKSLMTPDQWTQYGRKLANNPILKALAAKEQEKANPADL